MSSAHVRAVDGAFPVPRARRVGRDVGLAVPAAGFLLTILLFYPGILSDDAMEQFRQGLDGRFSDWHPPAMALFWSVLDHVWAGPQPLLLMQAGFYWLAVWFLVKAGPMPARPALRWGLIATLFSPAILNFLGVVQVDTQLAVCWVLLAAGCYAVRSQGREPQWPVKAALLVILIYGAMVRQNSALIAGPLVLYLFVGTPLATHWWRTLAAYCAVAVLFLGLSAGVNRFVAATPTHVLRGLIDFDLAGIALRSDPSVFPFPVSADEMKTIATCYDGASGHDKFIWGDCAFVWQRDLASLLDDVGYRAAWLGAILHHPLAYLAHRVDYFLAYSGLVTVRPTHAFWNDGTQPNDFGFVTHRHPLFLLLKGLTYAALATPFLRPGFWLLAAAGLAWVAARRCPQGAVREFALTSGVVSDLYILTYLPFGVAPDFRYTYLAIVLTTFGFYAVVADRVGPFAGRSRSESLVITPATHGVVREA